MVKRKIKGFSFIEVILVFLLVLGIGTNLAEKKEAIMQKVTEFYNNKIVELDALNKKQQP